MDLLGWLIVGLIAGWLSGIVVRDGPRGCLANILVGVLGGVLGGYLARDLGIGDPSGFGGAVVVAFVGAILVRILLRAVERR